MGGTVASVKSPQVRKGKEANKGKNKSKPRAPWRSKTEFKRLLDEGLCTRCSYAGHPSKECPNFRAAQRPLRQVNAVQSKSDEFSDQSDSGKEEP